MSDDSITNPPISTTVTGSRDRSDQVKIKSDPSKKENLTVDLINIPKKEEPFIDTYYSVRDAYENSSWFRRFFFEIIEMYGYPISIIECINQKDKIMLSWAMLHVTSALKIEKSLWCNLFNVNDPVMTADFFCRAFYEKRKEHVIPQMPSGETGVFLDPHDSAKLSNKKGGPDEK